MLRRLRTLSEDECYTRLYGRNAETVRVFRLGHERPRGTVRGDELRRLLEQRLDERASEAA